MGHRERERDGMRNSICSKNPAFLACVIIIISPNQGLVQTEIESDGN